MAKTFMIDPVPAPRMTRRDKWKKRPCVVKYMEYKDTIRDCFGTLGSSLNILFVIPMPKSWSEKKKAKMDGKPHQQKPDIDNYLKAYMDSFHVDDGFVYNVAMSKFWGYDGKITVSE